jgi:hypothetical protein
MMGLDMHNDVQLYMNTMQQCYDSFPEKNMSFCFNHLHVPAAELRSQKVWEFKRF